MALNTFIFTGIAGLGKERILTHLRRYILTSYAPELSLKGLKDDEFDEQAKFFIPIIELCGLSKGDLETDLGSLNNVYSIHINDFQEAVSMLSHENYKLSKCLFVHTHATNVIFGHYRSWIVEPMYQRAFEGLNIKYVIHLIDNVHTCRHYIREKDYPYTLDQIITWRDIEQMITEILTSKIFPGESVFHKSKVLAVNHCLSTTADLLFDENKNQIYTAFAISKIRDIERLSRAFPGSSIKEVIQKITGNEEYRDDFNILRAASEEFPEKDFVTIQNEWLDQNLEFREYFSNSFVAYDPSTIDENPLIVKGMNAEDETISISAQEFWPGICEAKDRLAGRDIFEEIGEIQIPASEVKELEVTRMSDRKRRWSSVERQIRSRDFRLIEQANGLVAYRPTVGGTWSKGVKAEVDYVQQVLRRPFFIIKDKRDGPIDPEGTLEREGGPNIYGEWDLSTTDNRGIAFEHAAMELCEQIESLKRSKIT